MRNVGYLMAGCIATFVLNGAQSGVISEGALPAIPLEEFQIMTPAEEEEYRDRMAELTGEARETYRNQQYEKLRERARAQGYDLPEIPPWGRNNVLPPTALADTSQPEATVSPAGVKNEAAEATGESGSIVRRGFDTLKEKLGLGANKESAPAEQAAERGSKAAPTAEKMDQGLADYRAAMRQQQVNYLSQRGLEIPPQAVAVAAAPTAPHASPAATEQTQPDARADALMDQRQKDYRARMQARADAYVSGRSSGPGGNAPAVAVQPAPATSPDDKANLTGPAAAAAAAMATATSIGADKDRPEASAEQSEGMLDSAKTAVTEASQSLGDKVKEGFASLKSTLGLSEETGDGGVATSESAPQQPPAATATTEQSATPPEGKGQPNPAFSAAAAMEAATAAAIQQTHFYGKQPDQDAAPETDLSAPADAAAVAPVRKSPEEMAQLLSAQRDLERARFEHYIAQRRLRAIPEGESADAIAEREEAMKQRMEGHLARMKAQHDDLLERMRQAAAEGKDPQDDQPGEDTNAPAQVDTRRPPANRYATAAERAAEHRAKMRERFESYMSPRRAPSQPPMPPMPGSGMADTDTPAAVTERTVPSPEERRKLMQERIDAAIDSLGQGRARSPRTYYPAMPPAYVAPGGYGYATPYPAYPNPDQSRYWQAQ